MSVEIMRNGQLVMLYHPTEEALWEFTKDEIIEAFAWAIEGLRNALEYEGIDSSAHISGTYYPNEKLRMAADAVRFWGGAREAINAIKKSVKK